jgi:hypothetical protein
VEEARLGFLSEAARWGDVFREPASWESYQNNLINNHFPDLAQTMIGRFQSAGMYPETVAPIYSPHGGSVSVDTSVTLATNGDRIYYTTDGSDPRLAGGAPNQDATVLSFNDGGGEEVQPPVTYFTTGHVWKHLDDGSNQGTAWRGTVFNDAAWGSGPSPLGYGGDNEGSGTTLSFGGDSANKFPTTYFRTTIEIPDPSQFLRFLMRVKYDDGAAIYVNGVEALRANVSSNARFDSFADGTVGDENGWKDFTVPTTTFTAGINTIAVEIHQGSGSSSDIRLDILLRGQTTEQSGSDNVSEPLFFTESTLLRSRAFTASTGEWSALNEAFFTIDSLPADATNLVLTEIHYHPGKPVSPEELAITSDRDDFEFLEFLNIATRPLDLTGVRFQSGINFSFPDHTVLPSGERLLLVRDRAAYEARYGSLVDTLAFAYTGRLSNDGEALVVAGVGPEPIHDFTYNDQLPWPESADGGGASLLLSNPTDNPSTDEATNWTANQRDEVLVEPEPVENTYATWAASHGLMGGPDDDDDGDTLSNFFEYHFGSNATLAADAPIPTLAIRRLDIDGSIQDYATLTFRQSQTTANASLTIEISDDLATWTSDPAATEELERIDRADGSSTITLLLTEPLSADDDRVRYLRLHGVSL